MEKPVTDLEEELTVQSPWRFMLYVTLDTYEWHSISCPDSARGTTFAVFLRYGALPDCNENEFKYQHNNALSIIPVLIKKLWDYECTVITFTQIVPMFMQLLRHACNKSCLNLLHRRLHTEDVCGPAGWGLIAVCRDERRSFTVSSLFIWGQRLMVLTCRAVSITCTVMRLETTGKCYICSS